MELKNKILKINHYLINNKLMTILIWWGGLFVLYSFTYIFGYYKMPDIITVLIILMFIYTIIGTFLLIADRIFKTKNDNGTQNK